MSNGEPEISEIASRRICSVCVCEPFLRDAIERQGSKAGCFYCEEEGQTISIRDLADRVNTAFDEHFEVTPSYPTGVEASMIREMNYTWHREGDSAVDAIGEAAMVASDAAENVRLVLAERHFNHEDSKMGEDCPFEEDVHYDKKGADAAYYIEQWADFERRLRQEARFFSRNGIEILTKTFDGVHEYQTRDGRAAVVDAGPGHPISVLYRARVFQADAKIVEALKRPDLEIGPPPWRSAPAGRMNAQGISVFYGAVDLKTALAEVRPPVGSRVVTAEFEIIRSLKVLDVRVLQEIFVDGSIFDSRYLPKLERAAFLRRLSEQISRPVMPDDEPFDYLMTQAIADYLATEHGLDGVIYPSAQTDLAHGNVAIFHRAARVEPMKLPDNTTFDVQLNRYTEEGAEPFYMVWEEFPDIPPSPTHENPSGPLSLPNPNTSDFCTRDSDDRLPTLRINLPTIKVHQVQSVSVNAQAYEVGRHRSQNSHPAATSTPTPIPAPRFE